MWTKGTSPTYWFDTQGPIIYLIFGSLSYLFGNSIIPVRVINNILLIISCILVYKIASKICNKNVGILSLLFFGASMNIPILEGMTALTEPMSIPFTLSSIYLCLTYTETMKEKLLIGSGILMAIATLIRITNGIGFLFLIIILFYESRRNFIKFGTNLISLILSSILPGAIVIFYFTLQNDLSGFLQIYFRATAYISNVTDVPNYIKSLIIVENLPTWVFSIIGIFSIIGYRKRNYLFLLSWAILFMLVCIIPPTFGHRIVLILPACSILAAVGLTSIRTVGTKKIQRFKISNKLKKLLVDGTIIIVIFTISVPSIIWISRQWPEMNLFYENQSWAYADANYSTQISVSNYLKEKSNGEVFIHSWAAEIYWLSGKEPPTKHVWSLNLLPEDEEQRLTDLIKNNHFEHIVLFANSLTDLFNKAEEGDNIFKSVLNKYFLTKQISNAFIFGRQNDSNSTIYYSFIEKFNESRKSSQNLSGETKEIDEEIDVLLHPRIWIVQTENDVRYCLQQTPFPFLEHEGIVKSQISYNVSIPTNSILNFEISIDPKFWHMAQNTNFEIVIRNETGFFSIFNETINPKNNDFSLQERSINLNEFSNQNVTITFVTYVGSDLNNSNCFAFWGNPVILKNE